MKIYKRLPSGKLSRSPAVDSRLEKLAAIHGDGTGRAGRWHLGQYVPAEFGKATMYAFNLADGSRLELSPDELAELVGTWNAREADRRELAARQDAADAADRMAEAADAARAELAAIVAEERPDVTRYAGPEAAEAADSAIVAASVPAPGGLLWQPDPRNLGGYLSADNCAGWRYSVRPLGARRGGYVLAAFDGYGVAHATLAEYATELEARAAAEAHSGGNWPAGAGIRWEAAGRAADLTRIADVPGARLSVKRAEVHSRSFRASINGESIGCRLSVQAAMAAAVAEYIRRRSGPDTLRGTV